MKRLLAGVRRSVQTCCGAIVLWTAAGAVALDPGPVSAAEKGAAESQPQSSVLYAGFSRNGATGTRVYVRATHQTPVRRTIEERRIVYHLDGAKLGNTNTANPMPTEFFGPPVSRVALSATSTGVNVAIHLSEAPQEASGEFQWVDSSRGATLHIVFPRSD